VTTSYESLNLKIFRSKIISLNQTRVWETGTCLQFLCLSVFFPFNKYVYNFLLNLDYPLINWSFTIAAAWGYLFIYLFIIVLVNIKKKKLQAKDLQISQGLIFKHFIYNNISILNLFRNLGFLFSSCSQTPHSWSFHPAQ